MRSTKGQNAVEYLMTYGWALLIVLVAIVLLWQLGFLDQIRNVTPGKNGFNQMTPVDWTMDTDGTLSVTVHNDAGILTQIDATYTDAYLLVGGRGQCFAVVSQGMRDGMVPGSSGTISYFSCPLGAGAKPGDYYRVNVTIAFGNTESGLPHMSNGLLWGPLSQP